jgi:hypothetical protein
MESCYVSIHIVYTIGRTNGYRIVVIDGYDRPSKKCHGTAKHCRCMETHFATINCCKKYKQLAIFRFLRNIQDTKGLWKNDKLIIPASLWHRAVSWYHHYLQHQGQSPLKETMRSMMYWEGMSNTVWSYIKSCKSCQINK